MKQTPLQEPPVFPSPVRAQPVEHPERKQDAAPVPPGNGTDHFGDYAADIGEKRPGGANPHSDEVDLNVPKPRPFWVVLAGTIGIVIIVAMLLTGLIPRHRDAKELEADASATRTAPVMVNVTHPKASPATTEITMPANMRPWQEVSIFARTTGYLKDYKVDISEHIDGGALMAEIDAPEIDQELGQAQAALLQSKASVIKAMADRDLAQTTLKRFEAMRESQGVTLQQLDEKQSAASAADATLESSKANVAAAEANVRRLTEMQSFKNIIAPFSGVVTGRAYDRGSLITANPTATDVKPMFKIAENDILRAFVNVPQSAALQIRKGMSVNVTARERPGRVFPGKVMGTTNYLDPMNRSLLTEVKVPNPKEPGGEFSLLPGMYVQVSFTVVRDTPPLLIPAPALVSNADGNQVAVLKNGVAHFQKVTLGQDFGNEIEIVDGLSVEDQIITNPGERVVEGAAVSTGS